MVSTEAERICIDRMVKGQEEPFDVPEGLSEVNSKMASLVSHSGHGWFVAVALRKCRFVRYLRVFDKSILPRSF